MTIARAEVLTLALPFRFEFRHSRASRDTGASVVVRLVDEEGREGHGEGAPREYVTGETLGGVRDVLVSELLPRIVGARAANLRDAAACMEEVRELAPARANAALCAVELALLDLAGRAEGRSAGEAIGPVVRSEVRYGAVVSAGSASEAAALCGRIREYGFEDVKAKVGVSAEADLALVSTVRETLGPSCSLRVDANGAWSREQALRSLEALAPLGIVAAEEPIAPGDLGGLTWLAERSPVPLVADESLVSLEDARILAERRACHVFNVRVSKCGGLAAAAKIVDVARRSGLGWMLGAHVGESAILSAAGRQLSTRCEGGRWFEGSYGRLLLDEDVGRPDLTIARGGTARALEGQGLGIDVTASVLARHGRDRVVVEAAQRGA